MWNNGQQSSDLFLKDVSFDGNTIIIWEIKSLEQELKQVEFSLLGLILP